MSTKNKPVPNHASPLSLLNMLLRVISNNMQPRTVSKSRHKSLLKRGIYVYRRTPKIIRWLSVQVFSKDAIFRNIGYCSPTTKLLFQMKQFFMSPHGLKVEQFRRESMLQNTFCTEITVRMLQKASQGFCVGS